MATLHDWLDGHLPTASLSPHTRHAIRVAVEEAAMNAALHSRAAEMVLRFAADAATLSVEVQDDGTPFDQTAAPAPPPERGLAADAPPGGSGLRLLRHYCRDLAYVRDGGRNRLTLRFPLTAG